jgi:hypothetical protein
VGAREIEEEGVIMWTGGGGGEGICWLFGWSFVEQVIEEEEGDLRIIGVCRDGDDKDKDESNVVVVIAGVIEW